MFLPGQELSRWHKHRHLSLPAVERPVTFVLENMHNLETLVSRQLEILPIFIF